MEAITLYTKPNCHLCEDGLWMLEVALRERPLPYKTVDISENTDLTTAYGLRIPVLHHPTCDTELAWPFTPEMILAWLDGESITL